jgi:5-methylcytosine-specific restriction endonuclease McrA
VGIKPYNEKRRRKRFLKQFHSKEFVEWVRAQDCVACGNWPCEVAHVRSRGAGGTWEDTVPLCPRCHHEQHNGGITTFERKHDLDLTREAERMIGRWKTR